MNNEPESCVTRSSAVRISMSKASKAGRDNAAKRVFALTQEEPSLAPFMPPLLSFTSSDHAGFRMNDERGEPWRMTRNDEGHEWPFIIIIRRSSS